MWNNLLKIGKNLRQGLQVGAKAVTNELKYGAKVIKNEVDYTFNNKKDPIGKRPKEALGNTLGQITQGLANEFPAETEALTIAAKAVSPVVKSVTDQAELEAEQGNISPMAVLGHGIRTIRGTGNAGAHLAHHTGVDQDIGRFIGEGVADSVLTAGVGKASKALRQSTPLTIGGGPKPALAGATSGRNTVSINPGAKPNLSPQVMELTIKDPKLIADGVKKGSASSPEWITQTRDFDMRRATLREKVQSSTSKSGKKNAISEMYDGVSTGPTRDPKGNPHVYQDEAFKELSIVERKKDGSAKWKEQHHLFSKQESFQFVERMVELGDDDDVLNMFLYAEDLDATMGGRLKNMLNMERKPHNLLHTSRKRKIDGRELKSDEMRNLVQSAKTSTELMQLFNKYVTGNVADSIAEAKAFNEIGNRMIKAEQYGWINELYDKNMLRKPVYRPY